MTLKSSGIIYLHGDGAETNDSNNQSIVYEVLKYIPTSTYNAKATVFDNAKNSAGTVESFNSLADFAGWSRHNGKLYITMTNSPYGVEVHSSDHPEPTGPGDQIGADVSSSATELEVGTWWGTETPSGDTNSIDITLNGNTAFVSGDGYKMRYRTRSRFSGTWGSWSADVDPYLSVALTPVIRENDIHIELTRNLGRLYTTNSHATQAFKIDQDSGAVVDDVPTSDSETEKSSVNDSNVTIRWYFDDSTELDVPGDGEDYAQTIYRRTKLTSGSWGSAIIGPTIGVDTEDDKYTCDFGTYDYLFVIDEV